MTNPVSAKRIILIFICILSCRHQRPAESSIKAEISAVQLQKTVELIADYIQYIPYEYWQDGCHIRSLLLSMEMAVKRIPVSQQGILPCKNEVLKVFIDEDTSFTWRNFHVAPLVKIKESGEMLIMDPALAPDRKVIPRDEWISKISNSKKYLALFSGASLVSIDPEFQLHTKYRDENCDQDVNLENMATDFKSQKKFNLHVIRHAMSNFSAISRKFGKNVPEDKSKKTLARFKELIDELATMDLLEQ